MVEQNAWVKLTTENPDHSNWYIERFRTMAAEGKDLDGEARLIDAMAQRNSHILDAGCGPGRVGGRLQTLGHRVVGVDIDPVLIESAKAEHPGPTWIAADLADFDLEGHGIRDPFDLVVSAGNVMTFLAPSTRRSVLANLARHLGDDGRIVIGFGAGRDYEFDDFFADAKAAGLRRRLELSTWDIQPFTSESDFLVAILSKS